MRASKLAREGVSDLPEYVPGKPIEAVKREFGLADIVKMASNENPLGPSSLALAALRDSLEQVHMYPEGSSPALRAALAQRFGLDQDMVIVTNGADNALSLVCLAFLNPGEEMLSCSPTFPVYEHAARVAGGRPVFVPLRDYTFDVEALAAAVGPRTKLVFLCNPNNPTGTIVGRARVESLIARLPEGSVLVIDEAYAEYVESDDYPDSLAYVRDGLNVIVVRTFSKIYGLAGLRVGYALAPRHIISLMERVREPFPVSRPSQAAALAALDDAAHVARSQAVNREGKALLYRELEARGIRYVPTEANFLLIELDSDSGPVYDALLRQGVIVRPGAFWGLPACIRVSIGREEDNRRFLSTLDRVLGRG